MSIQVRTDLVALPSDLRDNSVRMSKSETVRPELKLSEYVRWTAIAKNLGYTSIWKMLRAIEPMLVENPATYRKR